MIAILVLALAVAADPQGNPPLARDGALQLPPNSQNPPRVKASPGAPASKPLTSLQAAPGAANAAARPQPATDAAALAHRTEPQRFRIGLRAGAFVPRTELATGPFVAIEAGYLPPIAALGDKLRLTLSLGFVSVSQRSQKIIPGRGFDQGFVQRTRIVPIELSAGYEILAPRAGVPGFSAGGGYGLYPTWTEFTAFNTSTTESAAGHAIFAFARGSLPFGPGLVFLDMRYSEAHAALGQLGDVGTSDLSGFAFTAGYSLDL